MTFSVSLSFFLSFINVCFYVEEVLIDFSKVGNMFQFLKFKFVIERNKKENNRIDLCVFDDEDYYLLS